VTTTTTTTTSTTTTLCQIYADCVYYCAGYIHACFIDSGGTGSPDDCYSVEPPSCVFNSIVGVRCLSQPPADLDQLICPNG
jgi:hypothetical protein